MAPKGKAKGTGGHKREFSGIAKEGEYVLSEVDGFTMRSIKPYVHEFHSFAKGRWLGRELLDVLTLEFGAHSPQYWRDAISNGFVRINGKKVSGDYKFRNGDDFAHLTHRHEPPVMGNVTFVGETASLLAVCKPASMPMHPCGAYRYNSLLFVLEREPLIPQQPPLLLVHRLDRVTSGVVLLAKNKAAAARVSEEIAAHQTEKTYLARVKGRFPADGAGEGAGAGGQGGRLQQMRRLECSELLKLAQSIGGADGDEAEGGASGDVLPDIGGEQQVSKKARRNDPPTSSATDASSSGSTSYAPLRRVASFEELSQDPTVGYSVGTAVDGAYNGWLLLRVPISVVSHREGVHSCDASGKVSLSAFRDLGYCAETDSSLVQCRPLTGRTHQLRLHLQFLGCPIANDPCYGGELFYGEPGKRAMARAALKHLRKLGLTPLSRAPHLGDGENDEEEEEEDDVGTAAGVEGNGVSEGAAPVQTHVQAEGEKTEDFLARTCKYCLAAAASTSAANAAAAAVAGVDTASASASGPASGPGSVLPNNAEGIERLLHCDGIWLHAQRYRLPAAAKEQERGSGQGEVAPDEDEWSFTAPLPQWAKRPGFCLSEWGSPAVSS